LLHKPETKTPIPLIIFLHGSGERGTDVEKVKVHGPLKYVKNNTLDAFILAPQCPENTYWESESLFLLIQKICKENPNIDTQRIYLTGLSMGAWGVWNLAFAHPEMFAALVPIAGFVDRVPMVENCKIKHIPTHIYHGLLDDVVDVNYAIEIYKKLKTCSLNIALTIFDDANHDSWSRVYDNAKTYEWMFQQIKK
jgi:predicted peptidase